MSSLLSVPLTVKLRKGYYDNAEVAHTIIPQLKEWGAAAVTLHGRSRQQRYSRLADWDYIGRCATVANGLPLIGDEATIGKCSPCWLDDCQLCSVCFISSIAVTHAAYHYVSQLHGAVHCVQYDAE